MSSFKVWIFILASFTVCMLESKTEKKCRGNRDNENAYAMCVFSIKPDANTKEFMSDPDYLDEEEQRELTLCYGKYLGCVSDNGTLLEDGILQYLNDAKANDEIRDDLVKAGENCCNSTRNSMDRTIDTLNCVNHEIIRICFT